jgi:signal transduction histidine kinase
MTRSPKRRSTALARGEHGNVAIQVGQFALAGVVALAVVGYATTIASRRVGEREAITDARSTTVARAQGLVEGVVTDGLVEGDPSAVRAVADVVEQGVLDDSLVRVKLWSADGKIVYSDEPRLIGVTYDLGADEVASITNGSIEAEVSDLTKPENRYERPFERLLEVYLPIYTPSGTPVLFEAYYRYDAVAASGSRLFRAFAPITLGALVLLQVVQVPLAWSLARRLRQRTRERERLLQHAVDASEVERRQIAADLHDGVVQDLAGVAFALSGAALQAEPDDRGSGELLEASAAQVRSSIKALRTLLVDIYPPSLEQEGLQSALSDLAAGASARGLAVEFDSVGLEQPLPPTVAQLLYRAAQEGVRNVIRHAEAHSAHLRVTVTRETVHLDLVDDGRGYDPAEAELRASEGHVGLRSMEGLVLDAGGQMSVETGPLGGTRVHVEVPLP